MNQILDFETNGNNKKSYKSGGNKSDKVVRIFAILLILLAIALIASGIYSFFKNKKSNNDSNSSENTISSNSTNDSKDEANIEIEFGEIENGKIIFKVSSDSEIEKVIYSWNSEKEYVISGNGEKELEKEISVFQGTNTLNVKVVSVDGSEKQDSKEYTSDEGDDVTPPEINFAIENSKLIITVTDDKELDYVIYHWSTDENATSDEKTLYPDEVTPNKIEETVDIPEGVSSIIVVAYDASGNSKNETKTFNGEKNPEFSYEQADNLSHILFYAKHSKGIEKIEFEFNGESQVMDYSDKSEEETTNLSFDIISQEGTNTITITATSKVGTTYTDSFQWEYNPN